MTICRKRTPGLAAAFCFILLSATAQAQVSSSSVSGTISDAQGASVAGAKVTLTDTDQNTSRTVTSSPAGTFTFTPVVMAKYNLIVANVLTGNPNYGPRVLINGNPLNGPHNLTQWFDTSVFAPALKGSHGNDSGFNYITLPGTNKTDLTIFKNVPYSKDNYKW